MTEGQIQDQLCLKTITFKIPGRLPSWNTILGMQHWARHKLKAEIRAAFTCMLKALGSDPSTPTTSAKNTIWTAYVTLASYETTLRQKSASKRLSAKLAKAKPSTRKSG